MSMLVQLTDAGAAIVAAATAPVVLTSYKIGSGFGYVPALNQADIQGAVRTTGAPSAPVVEGSNYIRYSVSMAANLGAFSYGEVALYSGATLFAIGVFDTEQTKLPYDDTSDTGGNVVINMHLPITDTNYAMWADVTQANTYKLNVVQGPQVVPDPRGANPNILMVKAPNSEYPGFMAYTDRTSVWEFEGYSKTGELTVISATTTSVIVSQAQASAAIGPNGVFANGRVLLQVTSGERIGATRYCSRSMSSGGNAQVSFHVGLAAPVAVGDKISVYSPKIMPKPATSAAPGIVALATASMYPAVADDIAVTPDYLETALAATVEGDIRETLSVSRVLSSEDDGTLFDCTTALTITIPEGLNPRPNVAFVLPPFGEVTFSVEDGSPVTINGGSLNLTRTRADNRAGVALVAYVESDAYGLSGN